MSETPLTTAELSKLFHHYAPDELVASEKNGAAFANDVYELADSNGDRYVLRVLRLQAPETVAMEADLQDRLRANGINTPHYLELANGSYVGESEGLRFTLSQFIDGAVPKEASLGLIKSFAAVTARMHDAWDGVNTPRSKMQWLHPENADQDLAEYSGEFQSRLDKLINVKEKLFSLNLPEAVIHGDLWLGNVFADGDEVTAVFDLETAQNGIRLLDLGRTYASMKLETDFTSEEIIEQLFTGYDSTANIPLTLAEKENFGLVIAYVSGVVAIWHVANGTEYAEQYIRFGEEFLRND
jgi:Ser/Thr protein kinase RdoA (MazF antagonist)